MLYTVYCSVNATLPSTMLPRGLSDASDQSWGTGDTVTKTLEDVSVATLVRMVPGKLVAHKGPYAHKTWLFALVWKSLGKRPPWQWSSLLLQMLSVCKEPTPVNI